MLRHALERHGHAVLEARDQPEAIRILQEAQPGAGSCGGGLRCASTALRCSVRGRAAELTALTSFAAFKQPRRVSSRSARVHAPTPALRFSSPQKSPPPGTACRVAMVELSEANSRTTGRLEV